MIIPEGTSPERMSSLTKPISEAITQMMPESLFRFRKFNDNSLEAFKDGIIYAVTADMFNDPYDTLAKYDIEEIEAGINAFMRPETLEKLKQWLGQGNDLPDILKQALPLELAESFRKAILSIEDIGTVKEKILVFKRYLISLIETFFPILSEIGKKYSTIACFCESIESILMWSHYADSHKGFALEYNFRTTLVHPLKNISIFPVIYGEERVDISTYLGWMFLFTLGIRTVNLDISSSIKSALHKSSVWTYEQEWRLIDSSLRDINDTRPSAIPYEPVAIYYGSHMSQDNKLKLHEIALKKGIKEYEMYVDYSSPLYEMKYRAAFN